MPIIQRPNRDVLWSESGNQTEPSTEKQELGWVIEKPPYEEMNWIHYQQDLGQKYLLQRGISEWSASEDYPKDALVQYNGKYYKAILENKGKQPDINPDVWKIAFSDYQLTLDIKNILEVDNYADKLVYKDAPILRKKAIGVGYESNTGVTNTVGYTFKGFSTDGLFHNGVDSIIQKGGVEVARFSPVTDINESNKKVVTMDVLQRYLQQYKIGDLYLTTVSENPRTRLGYGTWEKYGKGRALVGHTDDVSSSSPDWTKVGGGQHGTYTETLTINQIPTMRIETPITRGGKHSSNSDWTWLADSDGHANDGVVDSAGLMKSRPIGGGMSHNNVQPSIVIYVWRRTA